jgi:hypothetical protein
MKGRIPLVHFKDMGISDGRQVMAEVGEGNLNWDTILEACKFSGVLWYIVEQDTCQRDPFESLATSLLTLVLRLNLPYPFTKGEGKGDFPNDTCRVTTHSRKPQKGRRSPFQKVANLA